MRKSWPAVVLCLTLGSVWPREGEKVDDFTLEDTQGRKHTLYEHKDARAVVLVFLGVECPMANRYTARLIELHRSYGAKGIVFFGVNSNGLESVEAIVRHALESQYPFPILLDREQKLADRLKVEVTPSAVLIDPAWEVRYRGRIDDHKTEELLKHSYLRDAIDAVLAGGAPAVTATEAVGCRIQRKREADERAPVTYSSHVANLLYRNCVTCHRPGQIAPFSLLKFEDAQRWAPDLLEAARDRRMPPWKPVNHGVFRDERILTEEEIDLLAKWVDAGAPRGDTAKDPAPPKFSEGWMLGEPDLVLEAEEYEVSADGDDEYRCFVLPTNFPQDRWVSALEIRPGNFNVVHHVLGYVDLSGQAEKLDRKDPKPGYKGSGSSPGFIPEEGMGGWAPGNIPYALPDGIGRLLPKGGRVVLEVHYHKNGRVEKDRTRIGLRFARTPIRKRLAWIELINFWFAIPAGAKRHKVTAQETIEEDIHAYSVAPHMHLIGREIRIEAELPDRTRKTLIDIPDWDFNWQDTYHFREPIPLPKGTKLHLTAVYDNSETNPNNPNRPPKKVTWGEQTTDEMCIGFLGYTRDVEDLTKTK